MLIPLLVALLTNLQADGPKAVLDSTELSIPFQRYTTTDSLGRKITFYLSRPHGDAKNTKLPVVLFIGGSGSQSLFSKRGDRIAGGLQNLLLQQANNKARIVCVEKPGVQFLDMPKSPGGATESSEEFRREHTLPRWGEANIAALQAVWTLPNIDRAKTLVIGHSEGAITASFVAAQLPQVTHVAPLAGAGPTQLYSLAALAAEPRPGDLPGDSEKRRNQLYDEWKSVLADPDSISAYWLGHPHRRWSTFLKYNSTELLLRSKAKIYLAHGTADTSSYVGELDVLRAELAAHDRDFVAERLEGLTHGDSKPNAPPGPPQEMQALFGRILNWFQDETPPDSAKTQPPSSIDKVLAARYFADAKSLWKSDGGQLWGKAMDGAMLFVDPKTRDVVANQADTEGNLKPDGIAFVGKLPASIFIANYTRKWAGVNWVIIMWPLPNDLHSRGVLMMHESWHRIQNDIGLPLAGPNLDHLDQIQARYWLQLEWRALRIALLKTGAERTKAVEDALLFRRRRHQLYPKEASAETALEMHEGMAEYTGTKLSGMSDGEQLLYVAKNLEQQPPQIGSFLRTFAYLSGPPYGLLLDAAGKTWRPNAKPTTNLGTLLADAYHIKLPDLSADEVEIRADGYQGKELNAREQERDAKRQKEISQAKARFVDGPVIMLPLTKPQFSFTYANLIPLEGVGTIYPTITLSDQWGSLVANQGALMAHDMKHARVPASTSKDNPLTGDGWKLTLNPGWKLVPGKRDGDYTVEKESTEKK